MPRQRSIFDFSRPKKQSFVDLTDERPTSEEFAPKSGTSSPPPLTLRKNVLSDDSLVDPETVNHPKGPQNEANVVALTPPNSIKDCYLENEIKKLHQYHEPKALENATRTKEIEQLEKKRAFSKLEEVVCKVKTEQKGYKDVHGQLYSDDEFAKVKQEYTNFELKEEFQQESIQISIQERDRFEISDHIEDSIQCPVCSLNITKLLLDLRAIHVENCLAPPQPQQNSSLEEPVHKKSLGVSKRKPDTGKYVNGAARNSNIEARATKLPTTIKRGRVTRPIPGLKRLAFGDLEVAVDAFSFAHDPTILHYFLTHFHSDHYGGISKNWCFERVFPLDVIEEHNYKRIIYCTPVTSRLLTIRFSVDPRFIQELEFDLEFQVTSSLFVTPLTANHCPGAAIFLFRYIENDKSLYTLHCGDFRVNSVVMNKLKDFHINSGTLQLEKVYLDTTYCKPIYNFPKQETVCYEILQMFDTLINDDDMFTEWFGALKQHRITDFFKEKKKPKKRFLILVGTYLIGKENLAVAILKRLKCQIYVSTVNSRDDKNMIIQAYHDEYLDLVLSNSGNGDNDDSQALIHLVPMKIAGNLEEMCKYFNHNNYFETFERCVGIRPTGWSFPVDKTKANDSFGQLQLYELMKNVPRFGFQSHILPQGPKTSVGARAKQDSLLYRIYLLPYSEHSLFRELSYFCTFLAMKRVIPTVNTHNEQSVAQMERLIQTWAYARERLRGRDMQLTIDDF